MARPRVSIEERWMKMVTVLADEDCWLRKGWPPHRHTRIRLGGKESAAIGTHRFAYQWHYGPIPKGMEVLHHCDVPACCNPLHLFLGSQQDNIQDCIQKGRRAPPKTHCSNGHSYEGNTGWRNISGVQSRFCLKCMRATKRRYKQKALRERGGSH